MFTFGYKFRPWQDMKVLADGASIRDYIADTAAEYGIDEKIHYGLKISPPTGRASTAAGQ